MSGVYNRLGQVTALLSDLPVAPKVKTRSKPAEPFATPVTAIDVARKAADVAHHHAIEQQVAEAQQRWLDQQEEAG